MSEDKIIDKIEKLLRLSKSDNSNEANLALAKAQELAAKYNMEISSMNPDRDTNQDLVNKEALESKNKTLSNTEKQIASLLSSHFRVNLFIRGNQYNGMEIITVGFKEDIEIFKSVYNFTMKYFDKSWPKYWKNRKKELSTAEQKKGRIYRNDYLFGFTRGVKEALDNNAHEKGLMIITPNAVTKVMDSMNLQTSTSRVSVTVKGDRDASNQGHKDGVKSQYK